MAYRRSNLFALVIIHLFFCSKSFVVDCYAMIPEEILVIANSRMSGSVDIAQYYMEKRNIPKSHLLKLSLSLKETMSREEYDRKLKKPVLAVLSRLHKETKIAAIVLIYGVPLKVAPEVPDWDVKEQIKTLSELRENIVQKDQYSAEEKNEKKQEMRKQIDQLMNTNQRAAVDSELALLQVEKYELGGWIKNPYFIGFQGLQLPITKNHVILVSRLAGPDEETVYRLINDTLWAEKEGLQGKAYFDARWKAPSEKGLSGYKLYDGSLHKTAELVGQRMEVELDEKSDLFPENSCSGAALYCGWYSLAKYVDSFEWQRGAIGYHMASAECSTLKKKESEVWCLKMLQKGVAATIGPVYEPYIQGFPLPEIFFSHLIDGYMSLGESYLVALPYFSWQMVLVGDPLYQPFEPLKN
jgi:uncharacterized protein (TIGR03790 family)